MKVIMEVNTSNIISSQKPRETDAEEFGSLLGAKIGVVLAEVLE